MPPVKSVEHIRVCVRIRPTLPALGEDGSINGAEAFDGSSVPCIYSEMLDFAGTR
jgi:hypothetical protein